MSPLWGRPLLQPLRTPGVRRSPSPPPQGAHMSPLAKNLKKFRTWRKWSQADLAKHTGLQPSAISHFESGQREPSLGNFIKLYKALKVAPSTLLGDNDDKNEATFVLDSLPAE